jgi:hypothetical protein
MLKRGMPAGVRFPRMPGGTLGVEVIPTEQAVASLFPLLDRLDRDNPGPRHPIFGPFTHDQWKQLNLRHAELHLGFFDESPGGAPPER